MRTGVKDLDLAYFIENTSEDYIDNSGLFRLIYDLQIDENEIYIDNETNKEELASLLRTLKREDRLVIRSVVDLSEDAKDLLGILRILQDKKIIICSVEESYLNGTEYHTAMKGFLDINRYYIEKKRKEGYEKAKEKGIVGRPAKTEELEKAIRLYKTKAFTIEEIENLSGISSSTLYRALKEIDKE